MKKYILALIAAMTLAVAAQAAPGAAGSPAATYGAQTAYGQAAEGGAEAVAVEAGHGRLMLSTTADKAVRCAVYAITGQQVADVTVEPGAKTAVELPRGYYIVKTPAASKRVLVN